MSLDIALAILYTLLVLLGMPFVAFLGAELGAAVWDECKRIKTKHNEKRSR